MANEVASRAVRRARKKGASPRVLKALVEAGLVESNLTQLEGGDRDSTGFLQQRPSQGWGPVGESVERDTDQFLSSAMKLNKGFKGSAGQLAQRVQRSAFPGRYAQRGVEADKIIRDILGGNATGARGGSSGSSVTSKTTPGVDRSGDRRALMASYLLSDEQHKPGGLLDLKSQLDLTQDTPAKVTVTRTKNSSTSSRPSTGPVGKAGDLYAPVKTFDSWASRYGAPVTAKQEPGHASGGDHDPAVKGATARDYGGSEEARARLFRQITRKLGVKNAQYKGSDINVVKGGVRYQIISRDHGTGPHLHVGMRRA